MSDKQIGTVIQQIGQDLKALAERMLVAIRELDDAAITEIVELREPVMARLRSIARAHPREVQFCGSIAAAALLEHAVVSSLEERRAAIGAQLQELQSQAAIQKTYSEV